MRNHIEGVYGPDLVIKNSLNPGHQPLPDPEIPAHAVFYLPSDIYPAILDRYHGAKGVASTEVTFSDITYAAVAVIYYWQPWDQSYQQAS